MLKGENKEIDFIGNEKISDKSLRKAMKDNKQKNLSNFEASNS
jgi:outer membrane protein insertion porin family